MAPKTEGLTVASLKWPMMNELYTVAHKYITMLVACGHFWTRWDVVGCRRLSISRSHSYHITPTHTQIVRLGLNVRSSLDTNYEWKFMKLRSGFWLGRNMVRLCGCLCMYMWEKRNRVSSIKCDVPLRAVIRHAARSSKSFWGFPCVKTELGVDDDDETSLYSLFWVVFAMLNE